MRQRTSHGLGADIGDGIKAQSRAEWRKFVEEVRSHPRT